MRPVATDPDMVIAGGVAVVVVVSTAAVPGCLMVNGIIEVFPRAAMTLRSIS